MPNLIIMLPATESSVVRPTVQAIVEQLRVITGVSADTKVYYPGPGDTVATGGSTIDSEGDKTAIFNTRRINEIKVEEDYDKEAIGATIIDVQEFPPFFIDQTSHVLLRPFYTDSEVTINFKLRFPGQAEAERWRDGIRAHASILRDMNLHHITYHYAIPMEAIEILKAIHANREAVDPFGETFEEYMENHTKSYVRILTDAANKTHRLVVGERQSNIMGQTNDNVIPDKVQADESLGSWIGTFDYKFTYRKVIGINMIYPISVSNQLLPTKMVDFSKEGKEKRKFPTNYTKSGAALRYFSRYDENQNPRSRYPTLSIPEYDDFMSPLQLDCTAEVLTVLTALDLTNRKDLLELTELGEFAIDDDILSFFKEVEYPYLTKPYMSVFHIGVYRNEMLMDQDLFECTSQLMVRSKVPLSPRHQFRVRLSLVMELNMLPKVALERLRKYPKVLAKVVASMNDQLRDSPHLSQLMDTNRVSEFHFSELYRILTGINWGGQNYVNQSTFLPDLDMATIDRMQNMRRTLKTVQILSLITHKDQKTNT